MARPHGTSEPPDLSERDLTIRLPPELLDRFQQQIPLGDRDAFVQQLLEAALQPREPETDWDLIEAIWSRIPDEEFAKLPADGSDQHDHYLYGVPKHDR